MLFTAILRVFILLLAKKILKARCTDLLSLSISYDRFRRELTSLKRDLKQKLKTAKLLTTTNSGQ